MRKKSSSSNSESKVNPPSPSTSDVMSSLCTMKTQNDEISANDEDSRNSQKHNSNNESRKRSQSEDEAEHKNEQSNTNKKARVSVARLPDLPASFNTLDDDCLGNVLDFVGKRCYSVFGRVNKRCHDMFCSKGFLKVTYFYGYAPLHLIQQKEGWYYNHGFSKGVFHYNRRDIFDWMLADESYLGDYRLECLCKDAIKESRLDILREVFCRANEEQLAYLRGIGLCQLAAYSGKLEILKLLRENKCKWDRFAWYEAKQNGHDQILEYMRNEGFPTEWQN